MLLDLETFNSIEIPASAAAVWEALVNPEIIQQYLFGTETVSDWQAGSRIIFQGTYEGKNYQDGGTIKRIVPEQVLEYDYWSSWSPLPNEPENYSLVTYELMPIEGGTKLSIRHKGYPSQEAQQHSDTNWKNILTAIKELVSP